jgi:hypothetical protein
MGLDQTGRRNPYVMLGVPFGASSDVAQAAFARQARGLRRQPNGAQRLHDLTWALNQITDFLRDPDLAIDVFRVPADPGALIPDSDGLLRPSAEPFGRQTGDSREDFLVLLRKAHQEALVVLQDEIASRSSIPPR